MREHYETLALSEPAGQVLQVTLNRPTVANAMNTQMGLDLMNCFEDLALDPGDVRCVVLTGAGQKAFCAGGDLKERNGMTDEQWGRQHLIYERMLRSLMACPTPILAAVNGAAYAGGCEIALGCDFIYAAEHARFALTEVTLGIMPGAGGTQNLPAAIGMRRAKEVILTGKPFGVADAHAWGMVNRVLPGADLTREALATAGVIARNAPISVRQAKHAMSRSGNMSVWDGLAFEIEAYNRMVPTDDRREGITAFNEKRKAQFKGR